MCFRTRNLRAASDFVVSFCFGEKGVTGIVCFLGAVRQNKRMCLYFFFWCKKSIIKYISVSFSLLLLGFRNYKTQRHTHTPCTHTHTLHTRYPHTHHAYSDTHAHTRVRVTHTFKKNGIDEETTIFG